MVGIMARRGVVKKMDMVNPPHCTLIRLPDMGAFRVSNLYTLKLSMFLLHFFYCYLTSQ